MAFILLRVRSLRCKGFFVAFVAQQKLRKTRWDTLRRRAACGLVWVFCIHTPMAGKHANTSPEWGPRPRNRFCVTRHQTIVAELYLCSNHSVIASDSEAISTTNPHTSVYEILSLRSRMTQDCVYGKTMLSSAEERSSERHEP